MNHRDLWFVGLLALAYLYLDASGSVARRDMLVNRQLLPPLDDEPGDDLFALPLPDACPRDLTHSINLRGDGAKWCLTCDEAFYPGIVNSEWWQGLNVQASPSYSRSIP